MSNLIDHANQQLSKHGMFDKDADYDGELGNAILELITVFAGQGHSGYSAMLTRECFSKLSNFEEL